MGKAEVAVTAAGLVLLSVLAFCCGALVMDRSHQPPALTDEALAPCIQCADGLVFCCDEQRQCGGL